MTRRLTVRFFASLADRAGVPSESVEIDAGADVEQLWGLLVRRHPALGAVAPRPLVACDFERAAWDRSLEGVIEVAFLPPFSGG